MPQTIDTQLKIEADGFAFTECPRWHDGQFYFSDVQGNRVCRLSATGKVVTLLELADNPSGLGFLPNGDLLVVSVHDEKLLRVSKDGSMREHADLSGVVDYGINDMVVDRRGRVYLDVSRELWNNDHDTIRLLDSQGEVVAVTSY